MTESERSSLRRQYDQTMHDFASRNSAAIAGLSKDMKELSDALYKTNERLLKIESGQTQVAMAAAKEATRETLAVFGLSPEDPKGIEETRATLRFVKGAHNTVKTAWTIGFTFALTAFLGVIAVKLGWMEK
jgi:hypothetical protein